MESVQCIKKYVVNILSLKSNSETDIQQDTTQNCDIGNNRAGAATVEASHPSLDVSSPVQKGALSSMTAGS